MPATIPSSARVIALCLLAVVLVACGGRETHRGGEAPRRDWRHEGYDAPTPISPRANDVLMRAIGLVGTPYRYGGNSPQGGFDCSGLVGYVYLQAAGMYLPRTSRDIAAMDAPRIRVHQLAPGDLVFFGSGGRVNHIGIYVGEGRFVHAPNEGGTVRLDTLDGRYWRDHYTGARRILR